MLVIVPFIDIEGDGGGLIAILYSLLHLDGGVCWLINGEKLDSGRVDELFQALATAKSGTSGPYR